MARAEHRRASPQLSAGPIAHEFYGRPSEALWVCGVTGTKRQDIVQPMDCRAARQEADQGRHHRDAGQRLPGRAGGSFENTTPDALELHRMLKEFLTGGARAVSMEVSSHGLAQGRVNGVAFGLRPLH